MDAFLDWMDSWIWLRGKFGVQRGGSLSTRLRLRGRKDMKDDRGWGVGVWFFPFSNELAADGTLPLSLEPSNDGGVRGGHRK